MFRCLGGRQNWTKGQRDAVRVRAEPGPASPLSTEAFSGARQMGFRAYSAPNT